MLSWRISLGALFITATVALCWLDAWAERPRSMPSRIAIDTDLELPGVFLMPLVVLVAVLATQETLRLAAAGGVQPQQTPVYLGNLLIVVGQWTPVLYGFIYQWNEHRGALYMDLFLAASRSSFWSLGIGVILIFLSEMSHYERPGGSLQRIAVSTFALIYVGVMLAFAIQIRLFWGIGAVAAWIITVKMGDIGAYTVGRLFGRTKMAPLISPGKTVEGAIGAVVFACLGSWISFTCIVPFVPTAIQLEPGGSLGWLIFGLVLAIAGIFADLAESLLKRDVGCKDSSGWMPGFGGVLDMLDSLLLTAPVAWLMWSAGIVGGGQVPM